MEKNENFIEIHYPSKRLGHLELLKRAGELAIEFNKPDVYNFYDKLFLLVNTLQGE